MTTSFPPPPSSNGTDGLRESEILQPRRNELLACSDALPAFNLRLQPSFSRLAVTIHRLRLDVSSRRIDSEHACEYAAVCWPGRGGVCFPPSPSFSGSGLSHVGIYPWRFSHDEAWLREASWVPAVLVLFLFALLKGGPTPAGSTTLRVLKGCIAEKELYV
jgi:hypothetical protein